MHLSKGNGLIVGENELVIDPRNTRVKGESVIVTHAHSDHVNLKRDPEFDYLMTKETHSLIKCRKKDSKKVKELPHRKKINLKNFSVSLRDSGHILGASQVEVEGSKRLVFTSDFKLQDSLVQKGAEVLESDILVIESTFGKPVYRFPERETVYRKIADWVRENNKRNRFSVLCGYTVGKAQELTKTLNEFTDETPLVTKEILEANRVYEECGSRLGEYVELNHNLRDFNVLIMPPHRVDLCLLQSIEFLIGRKVEAAVASGWPGRGFYTSFLLSDHADFPQLLEYVENSEPKLVLTHHGFEEPLASAIKKNLGIEAKPLSQQNQRTLDEFL